MAGIHRGQHYNFLGGVLGWNIQPHGPSETAVSGLGTSHAVRRLVITPAVCLVAVALALVSCDVFGPDECPRSVTVSQDEIGAAEFNWSPACRVWSLTVEDLQSDQEIVWLIQNAGAPPIHYGIAPGGSREAFPATPLRPGGRYRLILQVARSEKTQLVAVEEFTYFGQ